MNRYDYPDLRVRHVDPMPVWLDRLTSALIVAMVLLVAFRIL